SCGKRQAKTDSAQRRNGAGVHFVGHGDYDEHTGPKCTPTPFLSLAPFVVPLFGCLAQLAERRPYKANVGGSIPSAPPSRCPYTGVVVQLVRIPACHAGGRGFESRPLRQHFRNEGAPERVRLFCCRRRGRGEGEVTGQ